MVEAPDRLEHGQRQTRDRPFLAHEVEVEERGEVLFLPGGRDVVAVEPADEVAEGDVVGVWEAEGRVLAVPFVGGRVGPEDLAEEGGAVAEEFFVEGPVCVFRADVDVDYVVGEESGEGGVEVRGCWMGMGGDWRGDGLRTH